MDKTGLARHSRGEHEKGEKALPTVSKQLARNGKVVGA